MSYETKIVEHLFLIERKIREFMKAVTIVAYFSHQMLKKEVENKTLEQFCLSSRKTCLTGQEQVQQDGCIDGKTAQPTSMMITMECCYECIGVPIYLCQITEWHRY